MADRFSTPAGRRELLDGTAVWMLANGLAALSIRAVAADLGISQRTLLHHSQAPSSTAAKV